MKKKSILCFYAISIIIFFAACERDNTVITNNKTNAAQKSVAAVAQNNIAGRGTANRFCAGPYDGMPFNLVTNMVNNYKQNQLKSIKNCANINDARACWFDLERLKDYICRLETEVTERGCIDPSNLGLRFYYAAHSKTQPLEGVPSNYRGLHTLIIIPTYVDEKGNNVDFDPTRFDPESCKPLSFAKFNAKDKVKNVLTMDLLPGNIFAIDHGQLGPPDSLIMSF
jgi:hypothetical protein